MVGVVLNKVRVIQYQVPGIRYMRRQLLFIFILKYPDL